jgi:hypothetical protein
MNTFTAVFSSPDPEAPAVFWGAFPTYPDAVTAVEQYVADHPYWLFTEFSIQELPYGVML